MTFNPNVFKIDDARFASQVGPGPEPGPASDTYTVIDELGVINQPSPTYLVDGLIPENSVCLLTGQKGMYKSFFGLDVALTMSHGLGSFHGHEARRGGAIYIAGEGGGGIGKRIRAWRMYHKIGMAAKSSPFWLIRQPIRLLQTEDIDKIIRTVKHLEQTYGCQFLTLWFDTVSRGLQGALENEESWGRVITNAERIKEEIGHGMSFIGIAHQGKDPARGTRGSSVADSNADNVLTLRCDDKDNRPDECQLHVAKLKDDEDGQRFNYVTCSMAWTDKASGKPVDSIVLIKAADETPEQKIAREAARAKRITPKNDDKDAKRNDKNAKMVTRIAEIEAGEYTLSLICDGLNIHRGKDRYEAIREALPIGDVKTVVDANLKTKTIMRTKDEDTELVHISPR
jgi:AAA domain